jgi:acrylyl-CoA reductase (NADPH)
MGEGSLTIDVHYSALNYKDALALTGSPGVVRKPPLIPGIDCAGVVSESSDPKVPTGTAVVITGYGYGENRHGGLATRVMGRCRACTPHSRRSLPAGCCHPRTAGITAGLAIRALEHHGASPDSDLPTAVTVQQAG